MASGFHSPCVSFCHNSFFRIRPTAVEKPAGAIDMVDFPNEYADMLEKALNL